MRGAWVEMPLGANVSRMLMSLPVRGAWVEILFMRCISLRGCCRSPCGERGLKFHAVRLFRLFLGRSPCGERGLKSHRL